MTLTINLPPDTERGLLAMAEAKGVAPADLVVELLDRELRPDQFANGTEASNLVVEKIGTIKIELAESEEPVCSPFKEGPRLGTSSGSARAEAEEVSATRSPVRICAGGGQRLPGYSAASRVV
jgi:hypothetical protein